jgi:hypothetical protein
VSVLHYYAVQYPAGRQLERSEVDTPD